MIRYGPNLSQTYPNSIKLSVTEHLSMVNFMHFQVHGYPLIKDDNFYVK